MEKETNLHIEQTILGVIISDGPAWDTIADKLTENHFQIDYHKRTFKAMKSLATKQTPIDIITLTNELKETGQWDESESLPYLGGLAKNCTSTANITHYADILIRGETKQRLQNTAIKINMLTNENIEPSEMVDKAEGLLFEIEQGLVRGGGPQSMCSVMAEFLNTLDGNNATATPTGFTDLDELMAGGMRPGELIILAGRPGTGKTTLGMGIIQYVACKLLKDVLVFSMEMTPVALAARIFSSMAMIDANKIRSGKINDEEMSRVTHTVAMLSKNHIYIDGTPGMRPAELRARARRDKRQRPELAVIMVDYLQLMHSDTKYENRVNEIAECSGALKSLAKELNIPVIALAQLNRNSVNRVGDKRPTMSDLKDSGAIEQDADLVALIYRDELHDPTTPHRGTAEIIIDKQRSGMTGVVKLNFDGRFNRFTNHIT